MFDDIYINKDPDYRLAAKVTIVLAVVCLLFISFITSSCTTLTQSPKEKAIFFLSTYSDQYESYQKAVGYDLVDGKWVKVADVKMTDKQKDYYALKRKLLSDVHPLISAYGKYVDSGIVPGKELEDKIFGILDEILMKQLE